MSTANQIIEFRTRLEGRFNPHDVKALRVEATNARKRLLATAAEDRTMRADGSLVPHVQEQYSELDEIVSACDTKLGRYEAVSGSARNGSFGGISLQPEADVTASGSVRRGNSLRDIMQHATEEQREELKAFASQLRGRDVSALANLTPSGDGGVFLPVFVQNAIERNYSAFSPVADNSRIFSTDTGADTKFPVISDSESAEQIAAAGETGADDEVSGDTPPTSLTGPTMKAYKVSSKPIFIPRETFTDSDVDLVSEVVGALLARVTRFENLKFTRGTGTNEAEGFLMNSSNYEGFDTLDLDVALDLAYSVPALYRPNGIYMASDTTVKYLRKLKTGISGDKRYLWKEVFEEGNATLGTPARLHGFPLYVNNDMSDVHSDGTYQGGLNSPLAFGDFKKFVVRQAEQNRPWLYNYSVPRKDGRGVILFRRSDSKLLVDTAISKLCPSGS